MNYRDIVKRYDLIKEVKQVGCDVIVNGDRYQYKYRAVAKVVARNLRAFIGVL